MRKRCTSSPKSKIAMEAISGRKTRVISVPPQRMISSVPVDPSPSGPIRLKVYGVEKTLVDCFRHRRRLGMEPVLKALKDAISQKRLTVDDLWRQAQAQRMQRVMTPYLEALL